jgi:nucleotide-binding universal stress UspA family protein
VAKPKVMVALRDADSVESLIALACQVSTGMDAELIALHVIELPVATPIEADDDMLDRPGREILAHAQKFAAERFSREISTRLVRARQSGEAVAGEAREGGIDLLVMGYHQPHTLGEILLGSTAQYVVRHAPCRVIVQIPPPHQR